MPQSNHPPVEHLSAEVDESHEGQRLDRFLSEALPGLSRTRVQALIREGQVASSGATIEDVKYRVKPGERFELVGGCKPIGSANINKIRLLGELGKAGLRGRMILPPTLGT